MKKFATSLIVLLIVSQQILIAQNVGIGTTAPQATLDVKGNIRTGGGSNFTQYDSASGRITWTNSNLWVTNPQYLMKHSASAEGLFSNGAQLEYRNQLGNPGFFTNWSNGNGYFSGKLGINTINPSARLHIYDGASGITPFFSASMVVESNSHSYINLLSPDPFETGILFGSGTSATSGVISYNTTNTPKGFTFSDNGNQTRMVIDNAGNIGIGTTAPQFPLSFNGNLGDKISLWNDGTPTHYGFGIQSGLFQVFSKTSGDDIAFGYGSSTSFTERFRMKGNGSFAVNGNAGNNGQLLTSTGPGSSPTWTDPSILKTILYESTIPSFTLTDAASQLVIDVPVTLYTNSLITASITLNVSTAGFTGCSYGDLTITGARLGMGLIRTLGRFNTTCGTPNNTLATGELPMVDGSGIPQIYSAGVNTVRITFIKATGSPIIARAIASNAIIIKVIPQ